MKSAIDIARTLHSALERCDPDLILSCYDDDAELRVIDRDHPPSRPMEFHGKQAIAGYVKDICSRPMKHRIEQEIVSEGQLALTEACEYPDGTRVLAAEMYELSNGMIKRQVNVQAWDG